MALLPLSFASVKGPQRRLARRATALLPAAAGAALLILGAACGGRASSAESAGGAGGGQSAEGADAAAAFSGIGVGIVASEFDAPDLDARDPATGSFPVEPPITFKLALRVEINDGTSAGRVPGLQVLADGVALAEVGSAGNPQRFDFAYNPASVAPGQGVLLELRRETGRFSLWVEPLPIEIVSPAADQVLAVGETLVLRWSGVEQPPDQSLVFPRAAGCGITFDRSESDLTSFAARRDLPIQRDAPDRGAEPTCRFELTAEWHDDDMIASSPFRMLHLQRVVRRIQRFNVR